MVKDSILRTKTMDLSLNIIQLYKRLVANKEYVMSKQILKCATSIGANVAEANGSISPKDFSSKISIAYKEAKETFYWLELLHRSNFINVDDYDRLFNSIDEISRILYSILKTTGRVPKSKVK